MPSVLNYRQKNKSMGSLTERRTGFLSFLLFCLTEIVVAQKNTTEILLHNEPIL